MSHKTREIKINKKSNIAQQMFVIDMKKNNKLLRKEGVHNPEADKSFFKLMDYQRYNGVYDEYALSLVYRK